MEPEIVTQHEHDPSKEGEVVPHHGREDIPVGEDGGRGQEPDADDCRVLHKAEAVVHQVLVAGPFLLGIEEHENVDSTQHQSKEELLTLGIASCCSLRYDPASHHYPVSSTQGAYPLGQG